MNNDVIRVMGDGANGSSLILSGGGAQEIAGTGRIIFDGPGSSPSVLREAPGTNGALSPGITVSTGSGSGAVYLSSNRGVLSSRAAGQRLTFS
jgi:hypothetical protein